MSPWEKRMREWQNPTPFEESRNVVSKTAAEFQDNPEKLQKSAQNAADCDNFKSAITRLVKTLPVASITSGANGNINILRDLHPESLNLQDHHTERVTRSSKKDRRKIFISPKMVFRGLRGLNKGKAPGLQVDSLDLFIKIARMQKKGKKERKAEKRLKKSK